MAAKRRTKKRTTKKASGRSNARQLVKASHRLHELLHEIDAGEPSPDDVLAIVAGLEWLSSAFLSHSDKQIGELVRQRITRCGNIIGRAVADAATHGHPVNAHAVDILWATVYSFSWLLRTPSRV